MYVETVGTGTYQYECYRNLDNPRTVTGFTSYQAALDAVAAHRQECEECVFGCCVSETQDLPDAPNVSFANMNAKAVFDFIGVSLDGYGDGDWCGTIGADSLLAACHIALATGAPVLHSPKTPREAPGFSRGEELGVSGVPARMGAESVPAQRQLPGTGHTLEEVPRMTTYTVRYNYRIRPGKHAEHVLLDEWHRCRWVWNRAVETLNTSGEWVRDTALTEWRAEHDWLKAGSVVAQQQMLRNFRAKRAKGKGRRKFKSAKRTRPSLNYTLRGFSIRGGTLNLPGKVTIPVVWSRELPSDPSSVCVYQDSLGHWYASFVVARKDEALPDTDRAIGIDWGVSTVATTTDPDYDLPARGYMQRQAKALARYQRRMARRKPKPGQSGSSGYREAKRQAAKAAKKAHRQRRDATRKWVRRVAQDHGLIAVEDFKPGFLAKTTMARKSSDNAVGAVKAELVDYAQRAGRKVVLVPPAYTTMTCADCGTRAKERLGLSERVFVCGSCGQVADRDRNAARVILARAGFNPAGADAVRHADSLGGPVLAEPGIPRL